MVSVIGPQGATSAAAASAGEASDQHWVDRNNILYIQASPSGNTAGGFDVYKNSGKLKPVTPTTGATAETRDIQLTGTHKPANP